MQKAITILLLICLHSQPITNACIMADYLVNQDYIKEYLCINKNRSNLQCNGKCYLTKQLKENEPMKGTDPLFSFLKITKINYADISNILSQDVLTLIASIFKKQYFIYSDSNYTQVTPKIFHPPRV